eukprot:3321296-Lingulodinium_polyedra.AAC.1
MLGRCMLEVYMALSAWRVRCAPSGTSIWALPCSSAHCMSLRMHHCRQQLSALLAVPLSSLPLSFWRQSSMTS